MQKCVRYRFLIFVGCCNTKRLQDVKWPDEYYMTTQRLAQRDTPAGARKACKSNPLTLLKRTQKKIQEKDRSRLGVQQVSQYCFFLCVRAYCLHSHPEKKKSGNPPTNHLGFFVAHGCGCPWWFPPSLADRRCHLLRIESGSRNSFATGPVNRDRGPLSLRYVTSPPPRSLRVLDKAFYKGKPMALVRPAISGGGSVP